MNNSKLFRLLGEMFVEEFGVNEVPKQPFLIKDPANVLAVYGRTPEMKRILFGFIGENNISYELNHGGTKNNFKGKFEIGCKFSPDYLKKIFDVFHCLDESPMIFCRKDYLMRIQSKSIGFLLAPRIESGDD